MTMFGLKPAEAATSSPISGSIGALAAEVVSPAERLKRSLVTTAPSFAPRLEARLLAIEQAKVEHDTLVMHMRDLTMMIAVATNSFGSFHGDERIEIEDRLRSAEVQLRNLRLDAARRTDAILQNAGLEPSVVRGFVEGSR